MADDIRAAALAAFDEVEKNEASVPVEAAPAIETSGDAEETARARDGAGKFAAKEAATETAEKPVKEAKTAETEPPASATKEPPSNWAPADKELFKKQTAEAQAYLLRRAGEMDADYTRKTQAVADLKNNYQPVAELLAPHADQMKTAGFTPSSLIRGWYDAEKTLMGGGDAAITLVKGLVSGYKIDLAQLATALGLQGLHAPASDARPNGHAQPESIPANYPPELLAELKSLREQVGQVGQWRQQETEKQQLDNIKRVQLQIDGFVNATTGDGASLHPHFAEVEADMSALAQAARARGQEVPSLDKLYETAVWANPSTREKLLSAQQKAADDKRRAEVRAKAEAAKKASSSVRGAPGSGQAPDARRGGNSLRDQLSEAYDDAS